MSSLFKTSGTFFVLLTVIPVPLSLMKYLVPAHIYDNLLPVPPEYGAQDGEHIVFLQLGHQHKTGTPLFRFSAQEAKVEIPFVRHPSAPSSTTPTIYKHTVFSDSHIITTGGRYSSGLRTEKTVFDPPKAPMEGEQGKYVAEGRVEWSGEKVAVEEADARDQLESVLKLTKYWWHGDFAGDKVTTFEFTPPLTTPTAYTSHIRLHLPSLKLGPSGVDLPKALDTGKGMRVEGEWLVVDGARTWGVEVGWEMVGPMGVTEVVS